MDFILQMGICYCQQVLFSTRVAIEIAIKNVVAKFMVFLRLSAMKRVVAQTELHLHTLNVNTFVHNLKSSELRIKYTVLESTH